MDTGVTGKTMCPREKGHGHNYFLQAVFQEQEQVRMVAAGRRGRYILLRLQLTVRTQLQV